ncbi:Flp pilus assembly complex ATPase component TadA [Actinomycetaceae bacterium TAE3-ERU4]|nr:Flp pilus assembly complex ATPase component TadA [Actinomycetaceae bacterium TAE3-ERU4]
MELETLETRIRNRVQQEQINPLLQEKELASIIDQELREFELGAVKEAHLNGFDLEELKAIFCANIGGFGPFQQFLDDPEIEEIWCNNPEQVFVSRAGNSELTPLLLDQGQVRDLVERMLLTSGRRIDISQPFVDAVLPGGERLHVVIPPITSHHWVINIRKHLIRARGLGEMAELGVMTRGLANFLGACVKSGLTILVSGATQAGKTTMVRALCGEIPARERIITCEEVFELGLQNYDVVAMQTRPPTLEGKGEVELRHLVKESLRMRPERLIIGEVRGAESLDMIIALNSGVPGMCTIHANSAREALSKLCVLPLLAGENVTAGFVVPTVAASVDLVVQVERNSAGKRYVKQVVSVTGRVENGNIETANLYLNQDGNISAGIGDFIDANTLKRQGFDTARLLSELCV